MEQFKHWALYGLAAYGAWNLRRHALALAVSLVKGSTKEKQ